MVSSRFQCGIVKDTSGNFYICTITLRPPMVENSRKDKFEETKKEIEKVIIKTNDSPLVVEMNSSDIVYDDSKRVKSDIINQ